MLEGAIAAVSMAAAQPVPANPVPQGSPIPRVLPPAPPSVAPGTVIPPPSAPGAEVPNRPVRVTSVEVEGVTAYPQPEIAQLAAGLVGPAVPLPQIDAARQAIVQRYRADGYVLTTVAANLDNNGRLRFVVTEGRIASVKLDGDIGPAGDPGAALPQPAHREAADRYGHAGALPAAGAGRAGRQPARRAGAVHRHARRAEPGRPGQPAEYFRPRIHRQPRLQPDRAGRVPRPARLQQLQPSSARRPSSPTTTPSPTARISARPPPRRSSAPPA